MSSALQYECVSKSFDGIDALSSFSLDISAGSFYALVGPNGAGKTTALRMAVGLEQADSGVVKVFGCEIKSHLVEARTLAAYLPAEPAIYDLLKPYEYLDFVAALWNIEPRQVRQEADRLMIELGLFEHSLKLTAKLSHGMKQKLALVGALIRRPKLLILDEPLSGLDVVAARKVKSILAAFVSQGGTVILTTHAIETVERLADRIGIIVGGRLLADGSLSLLKSCFGQDKTLEEILLQVIQVNSAPL